MKKILAILILLLLIVGNILTAFAGNYYSSSLMHYI